MGASPLTSRSPYDDFFYTPVLTEYNSRFLGPEGEKRDITQSWMVRRGGCFLLPPQTELDMSLPLSLSRAISLSHTYTFVLSQQRCLCICIWCNRA